MGNFDFINCNECKNCCEVKDERSSELFKEDEQENMTTSNNQNLKQKPEPVNQPKESITEREQYNNGSKLQEKQSINNNNNDNNNDEQNYRNDGGFEEDSSFINDDDNIDKNGENGGERERSENREESKGNENGEEREYREDEDQLQDGENHYTSNKREV